MISKILNNRVGVIVISIILGLGLASLFRRVCSGANCIIIKGPPTSEIKDRIFIFGDKCYTYKTKGVSCSEKKNMDFKSLKIKKNDD